MWHQIMMIMIMTSILLFLSTIHVASAFLSSSRVPPPPPSFQSRQTPHGTSLASAVASPAGSRTAPSVVVTKFDSYASTFESHLVDNLKYCAPENVARAAAGRIANDRDGKPYASALDAGCGTGLAGPPLRELVTGPLVGIDLSPKMAELAAELVVDDGPTLRRCSETARLAYGSDAPDRLYDGVFTADLLQLSDAKFVDGFGHGVEEIQAEPCDLVVSADVLCYFGAVDEVLKVFADRTAKGGDVIFTTETMNSGDYNWVETSSGRYAHSKDYVERMASDAGLEKVSQEAFTPRMESGEKVLGLLHIFTKK